MDRELYKVTRTFYDSFLDYLEEDDHEPVSNECFSYGETETPDEVFQTN